MHMGWRLGNSVLRSPAEIAMRITWLAHPSAGDMAAPSTG
jgi:hypothetical protein